MFHNVPQMAIIGFSGLIGLTRQATLVPQMIFPIMEVFGNTFETFNQTGYDSAGLQPEIRVSFDLPSSRRAQCQI